MKYLIVALALILTGCGSTKIEYVNVPTFTSVICPEMTKPAGINPLPVVWVNAIDRQGYEVLGLRGNMYSNLSINSADTLRYIREQKKAIEYYKNCIEDHNSLWQNEGEPE